MRRCRWLGLSTQKCGLLKEKKKQKKKRVIIVVFLIKLMNANLKDVWAGNSLNTSPSLNVVRKLNDTKNFQDAFINAFYSKRFTDFTN
jgi:hypothetical protein